MADLYLLFPSNQLYLSIKQRIGDRTQRKGESEQQNTKTAGLRVHTHPQPAARRKSGQMVSPNHEETR